MRIILFLFIITITSCTVQKRVHLKGWHVQWNMHLSSKKVLSEERKVDNIEEGKQSFFDRDLTIESKRVYVKSITFEQKTIKNVVVLDTIFTHHSNDKLRAQIENEIVANEYSIIRPDEKKELGPTFWRTLYIILGLIAIAAAVLLFFFAANATMVSTTVLAIVGGVVFAVFGLFIILEVVLVSYTNGMIN